LPLDSPLFAGGAVLAVPVLSFRVAGERVPVVPGVTVLGAICVGRMGRAEHYVVAADGPALPRYPLPKFTFAVEMDDVLLPGSQIAHSARNGQALKRCHLLHSRDAYPGTGVGLAVVQKIVHRHQGTITIADNPGGGTRITLTIPAATPGTALDPRAAADCDDPDRWVLR